MSTRSTLWYSDDLHLYTDGFDNENVYLSVRTGSRYFEDDIVLKIPLTAWKEMRKHTIEPEESYLDLTDEELHAVAEKEVDEHRAELAGMPEGPFGGISGLLVFGKPDTTRHEMIERFIKYYRPTADTGK